MPRPNYWRFAGGAAWTVIMSSFIFCLAQAEEIRYDTGGRRDPFQPLIGPNGLRAARVSGKEALQIQGVVYDPYKGSYAVIGGTIIREGETTEGAKLVKVLPDRVVMLQESKEVVIWLREEIVEAGRTQGKGNEKK